MNFKPITFDFSIRTDLLQLRLTPYDGEHFLLRARTGDVTLQCPRRKLTPSSDVQLWMRKVLREMLRNQAKAIFPPRLRQLAGQTGLQYNRLSIHQTSSKWGSYSSKHNLNLSLYLMLLDSRYVDYTMLHELCHSREMNHGPRFWALLNSFLNGEARERSREMAQSVSQWYATGDPRALLISNQ
jgi:predicted metal-dependent hydrolase